MTRREFEENINNFQELYDFCYDNDLQTMESVETKDAIFQDLIDDHIKEYLSSGYWYNLRNILDDIDDGYDYYRVDGILDYIPITDDDFEAYKSDVADEMDGYWDDEDEEETEEAQPVTEPQPEPVDPEDLVPIEDEEISFCDLTASVSTDIGKFEAKFAEEKAKEEDEYAKDLENIDKLLF